MFLILIVIFLLSVFVLGMNVKLTTCITCNECYAVDCSKSETSKEKVNFEKTTLVCFDSLLREYISYDISDLKSIFEIDLDICLVAPCCSYIVK